MTADALSALEIEKRRLECEKLKAEIEQVRAPFWSRPAYIAGLSPLLIAGVTFISAWISGYFDDQRAKLDAEVQALTGARDRLAAEIEETRAEIDHVYLQLKGALGEAAYAVEHFSAFTEIPDRSALLAEVGSRDPELAALFAAAFQDERAERQAFAGILEISRDEMETLRQSLARLSVSEWAREHSHEVGLGVHRLRDPDGRVYDLRERRYLTDAEAAEASPLQ